MFSTVVRIAFFVFVLCLFAGPIDSARTVEAQTFAPETFTAARFAKYEQQLNAILLTRRDEERKFIEAIVQNVQAGKLPSRFIQTSFKWVQQKRPRTNFPFIYFEKVLRLQATKAGIASTVPPFDFGIYLEFDSGVRGFQRGGSPTTQGPGLSGSDKTTFTE